MLSVTKFIAERFHPFDGEILVDLILIKLQNPYCIYFLKEIDVRMSVC